MPLPARTAVLAFAALLAIALAAVRITRAAGHRTVVVESETLRERSATPAEAAATLAKLHAPPGFRQVKTCRFAQQEFAQECFWTPRALKLDGPQAQRISDSWPARAGYDPLLDFFSPARRHRNGIVMSHGNWELELGPELVTVESDSVFIPAASRHTTEARKVLRYWRSGTEIRLTVIGHWPHDKVPASAPRL